MNEAYLSKDLYIKMQQFPQIKISVNKFIIQDKRKNKQLQQSKIYCLNNYKSQMQFEFKIIISNKKKKSLINFRKIMLHQLLFALIGKPGTIIKSDNKGFMVDRSLGLFKDHQVVFLNQISQIGYNYKLINNFIQSQTCLIDYSISQTRRQPSVYRQSLATSLQSALQKYLNLIESIQSQFLQFKHFTLANIKAELQKYQLLFPEILEIINTILNNNMRGGVMANYIFQRFKVGNIWLKEILEIILQGFYKVALNQIIAWLLYGQIIDKNGQFFVHRVTFQPDHKFKFNNKNVRQVDITDWQMYTIESSMIPSCFIKPSIAGKILFIGKSTKILKNCEKISIIPSKENLQLVHKIQQTSFKSNQLEQIIQQFRHIIAQKMINLIMEQQNFMKELFKVNQYYLMTKGDFYQLLLQQSKNIDKVTQKEKAQKKLNQQYLQNTFMRLNSFEDAKKISFQLRPLGFNFHGFRTFNQLCPVGNIDLIDGKAVRFNGNDGALWHKSKQLVENDFHMSFIFRFKKYLKFFKPEVRQDSSKNSTKAVISVIIQNCQQVQPNSHTNPYNVRFLEEYLSISIGFISNEKQTQFGCFMSVVAQDRKSGKQILIGDKRIQKLNLMDQNQYHLKMSYRQNNKQNNFKISLGIPNSTFSYEHNQINVDFALPYYVNLQMGRAHIGFISNLQSSNYCVQIDQWQMLCTAPNHYGDHWSDLCLNYKISWPLDLVLTHDLLDNFSRAHKFLFPLRQTQIELEQIWKLIPRRIKQERSIISKTSKNQLLTFERRISAYRSKLCFIVSQLWKYFQTDVIQTSLLKLKQSLSKIDDFENLIRMVNKYIKSIQTMFFFNVPKIQKIINEIIKNSKQFITYFKRIEHQKIDEQVFAKLEEMKDSFDDLFYHFVNTLQQLAANNSSHYLFHLSQRMLSCCQQNMENKQI